jgi:hypothetical protein
MNSKLEEIDVLDRKITQQKTEQKALKTGCINVPESDFQ